MATELAGLLGFAGGQKGLAAASLVLGKKGIEPDCAQNLEASETDVRPELVDVARDEERDAHRQISPGLQSSGVGPET
jgi:hypothetical protein